MHPYQVLSAAVLSFFREGRTNIDLVHDNAQKELYKETEVIRGVQALLQKTLEQAKEQLRLNRKATYKLKNDASDKLQAQNIDEYALSLKSTDESLPGLRDSLGVDPQSVNTEEWQNFSVDNIELGDRVLQNSQDLRSLIDGILQQVASDQRRQIEATNLALQKRIEETRSAKGKLEEHLAEVLKEISKMEDMIVEINKAIQDKEGALRLAGTRIDLRKQRPNIELCRDAAEYKLLQEVDEITRDVDALQQRLKMSHESLKGLCRRQLELEEEIQIKAATLFIDEVQCKGIRETLKIAAF
ncbi:unnamed protein product [Dicrocoelium dendriticum]|nr:unnamed protein product [Dicrocoelium dendriticum]